MNEAAHEPCRSGINTTRPTNILALLDDCLYLLKEAALGRRSVIIRRIILVQKALAYIVTALHHLVDCTQILGRTLVEVVGVMLGRDRVGASF